MSRPFVSHVPPAFAVNWSEDLEELHEESSRTHFIDVWTRRAILARMHSSCTRRDCAATDGPIGRWWRSSWERARGAEA